MSLVLAHPDDWDTRGMLGTKQVTSLRAWLKTTGLTSRDREPHRLMNVIRSNPASPLGWEIMWVNTVFSFAIAMLYVSLPTDTLWTVATLSRAMESRAKSVRPRTIRDGVAELVGTLERTCVGHELGQGIVSPTRPRRVQRVGLPHPDPRALAHAARRLFLWEQCTSLPLDADLVWPWTVYACDRYDALADLDSPDFPWLSVADMSLTCTIPLEDLQHVALF